MSLLTAHSANELQIALCQQLLGAGMEVSPRGLGTRELLGVSFELVNPRNRLTTIDCRKWSPALAVAELAWHLRGDADVDALAFYTPRWREFAGVDGQVRGSCYGARIFSRMYNGTSQWDNVRTLLQVDSSSRRAVMNFRLEEDVSAPTNDLSCTNTMQFIVRENKLHAFVNMRSNDVIWGVPYDVFLFTSLQELMAVELEVELGHYHHYASSMHVYERHFELAARIARAAAPADAGAMPPMKSVDQVRLLAMEEASMRLSRVRTPSGLGEFEERCLSLLWQHSQFSIAA